MAEYIEREAFIESQQHLYCENCARRKDGKGKFVYDIGDAPCRACGIMDVLDAAEDFPAADVRPVVRGRWEDMRVRDYSTNINGGMKLYVASMFCPVCKRWHNEVYHYGNPTEMAHYCPNCGAKMEVSSDG